MHKFAVTLAAALLTSCAAAPPPAAAPTPAPKFTVQEARISDIQNALLGRQLTTVQLVELYLARIKAYNGTCVHEPEGILGPITTITNAGQINALATLNLRPAARKAHWGFDERKARSMTDKVDADPDMPDALEIAAAQDRRIRRDRASWSGRCTASSCAIKDQYDTFDMRTTSGADAFYANDRPPDDATFVEAPARRGRDHSREVQPRRICLGHSAQLFRRHVLQSLRHRTQSRRARARAAAPRSPPIS